MARPQLRVYLGPEDDERKAASSPGRVREEVSVPLSDVLPLLVDAVNTGRSWVKDFEADRITVSADFYEVLMAFRQLRSSA